MNHAENQLHSATGKVKDDQMRLAVLMSTYNGERFVREQIDSILAQKGNFTLDLWVRDDGSKDGTKSILAEYASKGKLSWYSGKNIGPARSFLDLLCHTVGYEYYAFADQDDYWCPNKMETALNVLSKQDAIQPLLYFSNAELVGDRLQPFHKQVYKKSPKTDFYTLTCAGGCLGCTMVFNSTLAKAVQQKPVPDHVVMHDFYIAVLCRVLEGEIIFDLSCNMKYRQHETNVVGVSHGYLQAVTNRLKLITTRKSIGIAEQAQSVLSAYKTVMIEEKRQWLEQLSDYKSSFATRVRLALSRKTKYVDSKNGIIMRMAIIMGNR